MPEGQVDDLMKQVHCESFTILLDFNAAAPRSFASFVRLLFQVADEHGLEFESQLDEAGNIKLKEVITVQCTAVLSRHICALCGVACCLVCFFFAGKEGSEREQSCRAKRRNGP